METQDAVLLNLDPIRQALAAQEENLQHLLAMVTNLTGENLCELQKVLIERLRQIKDIEQQLWSAFFSGPTGGYAAEHRMSMLPANVSKHNCTCIW